MLNQIMGYGVFKIRQIITAVLFLNRTRTFRYLTNYLIVVILYVFYIYLYIKYKYIDINKTYKLYIMCIVYRL